MTYYYETAPLPTWLAWRAHHLPVWWHHFESRATLVLELDRPVRDLRPAPAAAVRRSRRSRCSRSSTPRPPTTASSATWRWCWACSCSTTRTSSARAPASPAPRVRAWRAPLRRARRRGARQTRAGARVPAAPAARKVRRRGWAPALFALVSLADGCNVHFGQPGARAGVRPRCWSSTGGCRLVNTYHLFASITRERIEPEFQTLAAGPAGARSRRRRLDAAAPAPQAGRRRPRARLRGAAPAARRLPAVVLRPRLPAPARRPT